MTAEKATPAHTPGPWIVAEHDRASNLYTIQAKDGIMIAKAKGHSAARIVACVNACEGMLPEVLDEYANEGGMFRVFGRHMAKRDEEIFALRAEVERLREALRLAERNASSRLYVMPLGIEGTERKIVESELAIYRAALGGQA